MEAAQQTATLTGADIEASLEAEGQAWRGADPTAVAEEAEAAGAGPTVNAAAETLAGEEAALEAGAKGWVPKNLYKGDPSKWVDAKTFLQRGEKFNSNLQREVAAMRKQLADFEGTRKAFVKFHEETLAKKEAEFATAIKELRLQRVEAQRDGEDEHVLKLEDQIESIKAHQAALKKETPLEAAAAAKPQDSPVLAEWVEDGNSWFESDPKLRDYAVAIGDAMIENGEKLRGRAFLDLVAKQVQADFPRKFRQAAGARPAGVEGSAGGSTSSTATVGGKSERDLPKEDRALMNQFVSEGWTTKEKFLATYFAKVK